MISCGSRRAGSSRIMRRSSWWATSPCRSLRQSSKARSRAGSLATFPRRTSRPSRSEVYILDRPGAEQSIIFAGSLVAPTNNPEELAFQTFNDAFGGSFSSRINMNLREDKHWSYGVFSFAQDARGQRPWIIYAPVQTDKTKESLAELVKELHDVASSRPLTDSEVQGAKDRETLTLAGRWETGSAVSGALQ